MSGDLRYTLWAWWQRSRIHEGIAIVAQWRHDRWMVRQYRWMSKRTAERSK